MHTLQKSGSSLALLACASMLASCMGAGQHPTLEAALPLDQIGGDYVLVWGFNLPARDGYEAIDGHELSLGDVSDLRQLNMQCHQRMDSQIPSAAKEIGTMALRTGLGSGLGAAVGTGLGAIAAFTGVGFGAYALYGGLAGLGSGAGAGASAAITQRNIAKRYLGYACMQYAVSYVQRYGHGRLQGIGVLPCAFTVQCRPVNVAGLRPESVTELQTQPDLGQDAAPLPLPR